MGRRSHSPSPADRRTVEALAGYGTPEADIAGLLSIDPKTLRKHYRHELDLGHVKANAKVAENLFRKATGEGREAVTAAIFWLKTRARWRETSVHELSGRDGGPIETVEYSDIDIAKSILFMLNRPAGAQIDAIADTTHDPRSRGRR